MNALETRLREMIAAEGPLPLDRYMALALTDSEHGYYTRGDGIGAAGDFITAPEISQMFGELVGLWMADMWRRMGMPWDAVIVELGPGRGTLMADALRAIARGEPAFAENREIWLVEASPRMREMQRERLAGYDLHFADRFEDVPKRPMILIANEFLDALPVRQLLRRERQWRERAVGLEGDDLVIVEIDPATDIPPGLPPLPDGEIIEVAPARNAVAQAIGGSVAERGGAALVIDYGHEVTAPGDTLQAMKRHAFHPLLEAPGEADLTAHVDFAAAANAAERAGAEVHGPIGQRQFLLRLGIEARLAQLLKRAEGETADGLAAGFRRLTDPAHMGHLFKVLCIADPKLGVPTGYVADEAFRNAS
ncbi:MAG: class I SAM-dependent methyltransferase [Minwuia sp.]|uniref:class I SAM-dependent methyltransferase n=1 Tax=Minwuia sp. TaxID=2493630 RepID=UPI003A8BCAFD